MLVLSRKVQESVVVTETGGTEPLLTVTVLEFNHGRVRLGFEAHSGLLINRWEVWEKIVAGGLPERPAPVV
jgi:carbon storage regulator CsrA